MKETYFAMNRTTKRATLLPGFSFWEQVQGAFRCGIMLPDGTMANGIGRCESPTDFAKRCAVSGVTVL